MNDEQNNEGDLVDNSGYDERVQNEKVFKHQIEELINVGEAIKPLYAKEISIFVDRDKRDNIEIAYMAISIAMSALSKCGGKLD